MNPLELLYPPHARCRGCGDLLGADEWLCADCERALERDFRVTRLENGLPVYAAYRYAGPIAGMLRAYKFEPIRALSAFLADELAVLCRSSPIEATLIAVPLHPARWRERGFNQSELLARGVSERTGMSMLDGLRRTRNTRKQSTLEHSRRPDNVRGAFRAELTFDGERLLLVDDVVTTGSTVSECALALIEAGAKSVSVLCVADALRRTHILSTEEIHPYEYGIRRRIP